LQFTEEKELVSVESVRRVSLEVAVVKSRKLGDANVVAGLFPGFARGGDAGRFTGIGPAARECPGAVVDFADQENAAVAKNRSANVDFGSGITGLRGKERGDGLIGRKRGSAGHDFRGDGADLVIALGVKFIMAIGKTRLRDGLQAASPSEPLRIQHANILAAEDYADKNEGLRRQSLQFFDEESEIARYAVKKQPKQNTRLRRRLRATWE